MSNEWLKNLKVGDEVILSHRRGDSIERIEKLTPKSIVFRNDRRFRRENGREIGGDIWSMVSLEECTPEAKAALLTEARRRHLAYLVHQKTDWQKVPLEKLERIAAILDEQEMK